MVPDPSVGWLDGQMIKKIQSVLEAGSKGLGSQVIKFLMPKAAYGTHFDIFCINSFIHSSNIH